MKRTSWRQGRNPKLSSFAWLFEIPSMKRPSFSNICTVARLSITIDPVPLYYSSYNAGCEPRTMKQNSISGWRHSLAFFWKQRCRNKSSKYLCSQTIYILTLSIWVSNKNFFLIVLSLPRMKDVRSYENILKSHLLQHFVGNVKKAEEVFRPSLESFTPSTTISFSLTKISKFSDVFTDIPQKEAYLTLQTLRRGIQTPYKLATLFNDSNNISRIISDRCLIS